MVSERRARILRVMYVKEGKSLRDIAAHYQTSASTIKRWMDEAGIERRPPGRPRTRFSLVVYHKLKGQGMSQAQISVQMQMTPQCLARALKRNGIYTPQMKREPKSIIVVSEGLAQTLRRLYVEEHKSLSDIAAHYQVDPSTIHRWLQAAGIECRAPGRQPASFNLERYHELKEQGLSLTEISVRLNMGEQSLRNALKRHGLDQPQMSKSMAGPRQSIWDWVPEEHSDEEENE